MPYPMESSYVSRNGGFAAARGSFVRPRPHRKSGSRANGGNFSRNGSRWEAFFSVSRRPRTRRAVRCVTPYLRAGKFSYAVAQLVRARSLSRARAGRLFRRKSKGWVAQKDNRSARRSPFSTTSEEIPSEMEKSNRFFRRLRKNSLTKATRMTRLPSHAREI